MQIEKGVTLVFLSICAILDIRKKEIPLPLAAGGIMAAAGYAIWRMWRGSISTAQMLLSLLPGLFFLLTGWCTKEKVGYGDGILLLIIGLMVGFHLCFTGMCIGLLLSAFCGVLLIFLRKAQKNSRLPFMPFLAAGMGVCFIL